MKLAKAIDWRFLKERFGAAYTDKPGHPPLPTRLPSAPAAAIPAAAAPDMAAVRKREPVAAPAVPARAVMGIGSWPRPRWMVEAMHAHVEGRLEERAFQETTDDAVRLVVAAQIKAGVDVVTDDESRAKLR